MSGMTLPAPHAAVVFRPVADGAVLLHTQDEVYFGLNAAGARIWTLLAESRDLEQLCSSLAATYPDVAPEQLRGDVVELLATLLDNGLLQAR